MEDSHTLTQPDTGIVDRRNDGGEGDGCDRSFPFILSKVVVAKPIPERRTTII